MTARQRAYAQPGLRPAAVALRATQNSGLAFSSDRPRSLRHADAAPFLAVELQRYSRAPPATRRPVHPPPPAPPPLPVSTTRPSSNRNAPPPLAPLLSLLSSFAFPRRRLRRSPARVTSAPLRAALMMPRKSTFVVDCPLRPAPTYRRTYRTPHHPSPSPPLPPQGRPAPTPGRRGFPRWGVVGPRLPRRRCGMRSRCWGTVNLRSCGRSANHISLIRHTRPW